MIEDAIANIAPNREVPNFLSRIACDSDSKSIIDRFFKLLLASDVPFRCLHGSVAASGQRRFRNGRGLRSGCRIPGILRSLPDN